LEVEMKKYKLQTGSVIVLLVMLLSACSGLSIPQQASNVMNQSAQAAPLSAQNTTTPLTVAPVASAVPTGGDTALLAGFQQSLMNVFDKVDPSVVSIQDVLGSTPANQFGSPNGQQFGQAAGSGFVYDTQGHIVTNNHVIDGATNIQVTFSDGTTVPAQVIGADPSSDLAVLQVNVSANQLVPVEIADSNQVKVGQLAIAIGNPFELQNTMTVGIVSALGRSLPASQSSQFGPNFTIPDIIQTDAAINPGNSGGVLANDQGQLIGVTAAIESPTQANAGIGFAIPSAIVLRVVPALISQGHYDHPYMGISGTNLTPDLASAMKLPQGQRGALVEQVIAGGPAEAAGLLASTQQVDINGQPATVGGDVIIAIDGQTIQSMDDLIAYLTDNTSVGQTVKLTVLRNGQQTEVDLTLAARPASTTASSQQASQSGNAYLGITGSSLTSAIDQAMGLATDMQGVLVEQVQPGSPAELAGVLGSTQSATINGQQLLVGGDIIVGLDGQPVTNMQDLTSYLQQLAPGDQAILSVVRGGQAGEIAVTLGAQP
jgi:serine protease Do